MTQCRYCPARYVAAWELAEHERACSQRLDLSKRLRLAVSLPDVDTKLSLSADDLLACADALDGSENEPLDADSLAAGIVDSWHQEYFGIRIDDWKLDELKQRIAMANRRGTAMKCRTPTLTSPSSEPAA